MTSRIVRIAIAATIALLASACALAPLHGSANREYIDSLYQPPDSTD
jgi:hypothetical protein